MKKKIKRGDFVDISHYKPNDLKIGYQGVKGSFSEEAMISFFGENNKSLNYEKYKSNIDKRNKMLEYISQTYSESWRPKRLLVILSRGTDRANKDTQKSNSQMQYHRKTFSSDDKSNQNHNLKQQQRENGYIPSSKHVSNLK